MGLGSYAAISLALYNVVAAPVLVLGAIELGGAGFWGAAVLHSFVATLFIYAFATRRWKDTRLPKRHSALANSDRFTVVCCG